MPSTLVEELIGFRIRPEQLKQLPGNTDQYYLRQAGGALILEGG
ncbi:hypothetical protein [Paenibacillus agricola]|nr:hypothetical protein [Paenibacillus agricola]